LEMWAFAGSFGLRLQLRIPQSKEYFSKAGFSGCRLVDALLLHGWLPLVAHKTGGVGLWTTHANVLGVLEWRVAYVLVFSTSIAASRIG